MQNDTTPMLRQYHQIKAEHKDCILFFRLGDFYEMFYEDATTASRILDLVLTSRGKDVSGKIPMCGIPYHAADAYISKLIKAGQKIAICEQVEDPELAQGIVKRAVTRIITSGTFLDENSIEPRYIFSLSPNSKDIGVAFLDPASGTIETNQYTDKQRIIELLGKLPIYECIFPQSFEGFIKELFKHPLLGTRKVLLSPSEDWCFNPEIAKRSLCEHFGVYNLNGFGIDDLDASVSSSGALLEYLKRMNKQPLRHIDKISLYADHEYVFISPAACRGLELESLLEAIDQTLTPMGKRRFRLWLYHPLVQTAAIIQRQDAVTLLRNNSRLQSEFKKQLSHVPDIEKSLSRLSCGYVQAKDILAIRNTLARWPDIQAITEPLSQKNPLFALEDIPELRQHLAAAVNPDIPLSNPEGKILRKGYHAELDSLREIQENGRLWLKNLQEKEIKRTGIHTLKIGFNKVFGYYIEVSKGKTDRVPEDYIRKQTLVNGERFITPELKDYEEKILTAQERILKIENEVLQKLRQEILDNSIGLHAFCDGLATLDVLFSLSLLAQSPHYILPEISDDTTIDIREGRHPVVEKNSTEPFVPNDTQLDCGENHFIILTGPNMAGKSTYIRQTAILVILAQIGSYLPATAAHLGVVDKIFTRIGAHDDISKGQSTFMVEMNETADILNNLTQRSLIILDEIGRGTSTFDGLSLAWALAEHLQKTKARTLFATHFHELTALAEEFPGVKNYNVAVKEWKDEIIFLHKIIPGGSDDSYGIYVAKLAGIPQEVIDRSKHILTRLELNSNFKEQLSSQNKKSAEEQFSLFSRASDPVTEKIKSIIEAMDINQLTPLEALNKMQEMKHLFEKEN
ncbi:MAG: DNA mismatch repair protein MutS [Candidatus Omnitrophota bacterium]